MSHSDIAPGDFYDRNVATFGDLLREVEFTIKAVILSKGIKVHSVSGRIKEKTSFLEKIERKQYASHEVVRDVVGVRVVCLFLSDLARVKAVLEESFDVHEIDDKVEGSDSTSFGYMSVHYICTLGEDVSGPRYDSIKAIEFEVQCRTIVMDAWANVSHYLSYKGDASVPEALKRDFNALSGLFYVADQHFELFFDEASRSRTRAMTTAPQDGDWFDEPVNLDTMLGLLTRKYPDRNHADSSAVSEFVEEISILPGYETIGDVDEMLEAARAAVVSYEEDYPPGDTEDLRYADVGIARMAMAIADKRYSRSKYKNERFNKYRHMMK